ncbi:MAG: tetratricopeptide repeat protein [Chthoniobacterales bacterium]
MSTEYESDLELELAHVLLIDVVGYSKLLVNDQIEVLQELNQTVRATRQFRAAEAKGTLMRLPTGDGMALLFFDATEAPVLCALEVSAAVRERPQLKLRMGVHSGPIKEISDVNDRSNFAGAGINIAQRVLDCGDAGHILLSKRVAEDLSSYKRWHPHLHDLGECEVKHGVKLHLYNLCKDGLGNPAIPSKLEQQRLSRSRPMRQRWAASSRSRKAILTAAGLFAVAGILLAGWFLSRRPPPADKSIAVLPFGNLSAESSDAYFVAGVQEDILTDLAKVADLKVISRTSVMQYKPDAPRNLRDIARALGVAFVLEGNVQRSKNRIRVFAQLIDARTDMHVWASRYDRELEDVFAIQSEIAAQIVAQLKATLSPTEKAAIEDRPTADMVAYDLYVRGKAAIDASHLTARGREALDEAVSLLGQAINRDPRFFSAYYQLAHAHDQFFLRFDHSAARLAMAAAAIETLQRLQPHAGESHLALAKHLYWGYRDYERARQELHIAQSALPNDPLPPLLTGYIARRQGDWENALKNLHRALELDPRNSLIIGQIARAYSSLRRFEEAAAVFDRGLSAAPEDLTSRLGRASIELSWHGDTRPLRTAIEAIISADPGAAPTVADTWLYLAFYERDAVQAARALALLGSNGCYNEGIPIPRSWCEGLVARMAGDGERAQKAFESAHAESERTLREQPDHAGAMCAAAFAKAGVGNKGDAIRQARRAVEMLPISKDAVEGPILAEYLAVIYAWTGEVDLAVEQLALLAKTPSDINYGNLRLHPYWDPLRGDPRFENIVQSLAPK